MAYGHKFKLKFFYFTLLVLIGVSNDTLSQPYYAINYPVAEHKNVLVGIVENYCGYDFHLTVNIYKPVGDGNTKRPVIICSAPGGPWSKYDQNDHSIDSFAINFAQRGYVGVTMNYRRGIHLYPFEQGLPLVNNLLLCGLADRHYGFYAADHSELQRAVYRASQDIKSVVKFMKNNRVFDSTCISNIFLMGHSGGGVVSLYAALLDDIQERPAACNALATLQNPQWQDVPFQPCGPQNKDNLVYSWWNNPGDNFELAYCYTRPDLGGIEGDLLSNSPYDGSVLGVASLAGGIIRSDSLLLNGSQQTAVYLYHQVNDYITPFGVDTMARCFAENFDLVTPRNMLFLPVVGGSGWLNSALYSRNWTGGHKLWDYAVNQLPPNIPLLWCAANHDFQPSWQIVMDSISLFFSQKIQSFGNCSVVNSDNITEHPEVTIYPNPVSDQLNIQISKNDSESTSIEIFDTMGQLMYNCITWDSKIISINEIAQTSGLYSVRIKQKNFQTIKKTMFIIR